MRIPQILFMLILGTLLLSGIVWADSLNVSLAGEFHTDWGWARSVVKAGDYAYVADQANAGLHILNVSNAAMPMEVGRIRELGGITSLAVSGTHLYCTSDSADLAIFDISDPAHPAFQSLIGTGYWIGGMKVALPYVYCAYTVHEGTSGSPALRVIDVSNPVQPFVVSTLILGGIDSYGYATAIDLVGSHAYVAWEGNGGGLAVVDISSPTQPAVLGTCSVSANHSPGVVVGGNYAYLCGQGAGLFIVDVSNPAAPTLTGTLATRDWAMQLVLHGNYGYLADDAAGLSILDMTNPAQPALLGQLGTYSWCEGITYADPYVYLTAGESGLHIVDVSDPNSPVRLSQLGRRSITAVAVAGTYAYVGSEGEVNLLNVLNVADPARPVEVTRMATTHAAKRLIISGNYLYAMDDFGMQVVSLANPAAPAIVGTISAEPDNYVGMQVNGNYVYLGLFGRTVDVVDVSDPTIPAIVGSCSASGYVYNLSANGSMLYALNESGLSVIDASNPQSPVLRGTCAATGDWAAVAGNRVYVSGAGPSSTDMLYVIDASDAMHPVIADAQDVGWTANGMTVSGNLLYVAAENHGVRVLDLQDPLHPAEAGWYDSDTEQFYSAKSIALGNGLIYATSYYELAILRFEPLAVSPHSITPVSEFALEPAYPNPFNSSTRLTFTLLHSERVALSLYDVLGRKVRDITDQVYPQGKNDFLFNANGLSSGTYFMRILPPRPGGMRKIVLIR